MAERNIIDSQNCLSDFMHSADGDGVNFGVVRMVACGDTGPVRNLERVVMEKGPLHVLGEAASILNRADFVFANLEAVFSNRGNPLDRIPVFRLNPKAFEIVTAANMKVVSLANNHMFDYGPEAFVDTISLLKKNKIKYFGAGLTIDQAIEPAIITINEIKFGFLGFREKEHKNFNHNGVITPQINKKDVIEKIKNVKEYVDILILSLHFGWEYILYPSPKDVKMCRSFIDAGADIILGHHPHYPQGIEKYKNGLICYSLGNFIWDQNFIGHTNSSYMLDMEITKKGVRKVKIIPYQMNNEYQLEIKEEKKFIKEISSISEVLFNYTLLDEKWYFICRNKVLIFTKDLLERIIKKKLKLDYLKNWFKNITHPRAVYTWISFFKYVVTIKAFKYEFKKIWKKMQAKRNGLRSKA